MMNRIAKNTLNYNVFIKNTSNSGVGSINSSNRFAINKRASISCCKTQKNICPNIEVDTIATIDYDDNWILRNNTTILSCQTLTIKSQPLIRAI